MAQREEESLIEEMRQAIRGDRERAAARVAKPPEPPAAQPEPQPEPPKRTVRRWFGRSG